MEKVDPTNQDSEHLQRSLDMVWEIWRSMIYELRVPLVNAQAYAHLLLMTSHKDNPLNERQTKYLNHIREATQYASSAVENLNYIYTLVIGQRKPQIEKIDLQSLLQELNLNYTVPANLPEIWADRALLQRALMQILSQVTDRYYDAEKNPTILTISFDETWVIFDITTRGKDIQYFPEYPNPELLFSRIIIDKHSGQFQWNKEDQALKIVFTLPIKSPVREDVA